MLWNEEIVCKKINIEVKKLVRELLKLAKNDGYKEMFLDTIKPLQEAIHLYKKLGFQECDSYYNPMEDVIYMKKEL